MFKSNGDLYFLKDDRISSGNVNMAKIYERLLSTNILREKRQDSFDPHRVTLLGEKRRDSFDPHRVTLLGEDIICRVNLLEIPRVMFFFYYYMIDFLRLFQKRSFVLSSKHENQNVATIGTLLDQFMLSCQ